MARMEFEALVEEGRGGGALVRLPPEAAEVFATRARFPVRVTFNGIPHRGSTMPMRDGTFCVGITRAVQAKAGVSHGDTVAVAVERDEEERTVDVPPDLAEALSAHPEARARFDGMAYTQRKDYASWVASARKPETRRRRLEEAVRRIAEGARLS